MRRYQGEKADVTYDIKRCIHAEECVKRLSSVFDNHRRPWIDPNGAAPDDLLAVVLRCPSGALHMERMDGGEIEGLPVYNTITLWRDGPLQFHGDLHITAAGVNLEPETRATLCRCGASSNKPFCDNAHKNTGFIAADLLPDEKNLTPQIEGGPLKITVHSNGPVEVQGHFEIRNEAGELLYSGTETWLCRCGGSSNKPFCDSTHKRIGFTAD